MRFAFSVVAAALAAVASAVSEPELGGNPIAKPGLNEQVPAGEPYQITWQPTTKGPINIILLRGPSENVVPIATIASGISNSGNYLWTPPTSLEPDVTHYGIKLIDVPTGKYQYSTQFGISNPGGKKHHTSKTETATSSGNHTMTATHTKTATATHTKTTSCPTKTHTKTYTKHATTAKATAGTTLKPSTTAAATAASAGGVSPSQASISPKPSTAAGERVVAALGGAVAGAIAVVAAL